MMRQARLVGRAHRVDARREGQRTGGLSVIGLDWSSDVCSREDDQASAEQATSASTSVQVVKPSPSTSTAMLSPGANSPEEVSSGPQEVRKSKLGTTQKPHLEAPISDTPAPPEAGLV